MLSLNALMTFAAWTIGALGIGGIIAAAAAAIVFGPTVVAAIVRPVLSRFLACTGCVVATVSIIATVSAYWLGHHHAAKECRADELEATLRNARIDAQAAHTAQADEAQRADDIEQKAKDQHDRDQAYIDQLKSKPACALDDSDLNAAGGLRHRARPSGAKPAGKAR